MIETIISCIEVFLKPLHILDFTSQDIWFDIIWGHPLHSCVQCSEHIPSSPYCGHIALLIAPVLITHWTDLTNIIYRCSLALSSLEAYFGYRQSVCMYYVFCINIISSFVEKKHRGIECFSPQYFYYFLFNVNIMAFVFLAKK